MAADPITTEAAAELLGYDISDNDDPFNENPQAQSPRGTKRKSGGDGEDGLGLDEEVKVKKQRKPTVKLDENRLLTANGIPKLRTIARASSVTRKLRMKGKGHEFTDIARLLNFYQLWLDGLFPRAKFLDGLELIEKVGHSKRMQVMRKEWIDEGKPGYIKPGTELVESILRGDGPQQPSREEIDQPVPQSVAEDAPPEDDGMFFPSPSKTGPRVAAGVQEDPDDDELDALLAMQGPSTDVPKPAVIHDDSEGDDDLDALLAEQDSRRLDGPLLMTRTAAPAEDEDEDDLDALLAEQDTRQPTLGLPQQPETYSRLSTRDSSSKKRRTIFDDSDSEDDAAAEDTDSLPPLPQPILKSTPPTSPLPAQAAPKSSQPHTPHKARKDESQESAANIFSSSPIRNEEQDVGSKVTTPLGKGLLKTKTWSSSPLPNNPELEDDLDALLADM